MKIICPSNHEYYKKFNFPAGEMHIVLNKELTIGTGLDIEFNYTCNEDIVELLLLCHTLKENFNAIINLIIPYMPFGQADRVNQKGECFSLKWFCNLVNTQIQPAEVTVYDPHSDVTPALLDNVKVIHQWEILEPIIRENFANEDYILVSPDQGAVKKSFKLAQSLKKPIIYCNKHRNVLTGEIEGVEVLASHNELLNKTLIIVDDMVVGGASYVAISEEIQKISNWTSDIALVTTNGIYSKGLDVFKNIHRIYNRKGRVK